MKSPISGLFHVRSGQCVFTPVQAESQNEEIPKPITINRTAIP